MRKSRWWGKEVVVEGTGGLKLGCWSDVLIVGGSG